MAITDVNGPVQTFDPASVERAPHAPASPARHASLAALPRLHAEAGDNLRRGQFLSRAALACVILMLSGMAALLLTALCGGGSLKADFAWSVLLLLGITAMTRTYIRGFARALRRVPLAEAAADLRMLLLYTGLAWGSGAFLIMPDLPATTLVLAFALVPSLALTLCLKDARGTALFTTPATMATAGAALLGAWPPDLWLAAAILTGGLIIGCLGAGQAANLKKAQAMLLSHCASMLP